MKIQPEVSGHGNPYIFQVVGFQNSGKTTFLSDLIQRLSLENYQVATIKHHGHGGKPDVIQGKDSSIHLEAGAMAALVEGDSRLILQVEKLAVALDEQIRLLALFPVDFIFIEGNKQEAYPKAVIVRNKEDEKLVLQLANIKVVYYWHQPIPNSMIGDIPQFHINDEEGRAWLVKRLTRERVSNS